MQIFSRLHSIIFEPRSAHSQSGFGVGSMLLALGILMALAQGTRYAVSYYQATPQINEAAAHLDNFATAAAQYVRDNHAALTASLPLNGAASTITTTTLRDSGYLSPNLATANPFGQTASLRVRYVTQGTGANQRNVLEPLVITENGRAIEDGVLLRIAGKVRAGGSIRSNSPNIAIGNSGGWEVPLASFGGTPGAGRLAVGMFFSDAGMIEDYLYRSSVPGRPEVNRMNTDIDMDGSSVANAETIQAGEVHLTRIVAEATACTPDGALARNSIGDPMICRAGIWTQAASLSWVGGQGQRMPITAANGQTMWIQNENGRFRWVNSNWSQELASIDQSGNLSASGRLKTGEYLQIDGTATEGTACSPDGLVGRTASGLILSCQAS